MERKDSSGLTMTEFALLMRTLVWEVGEPNKAQPGQENSAS